MGTTSSLQQSDSHLLVAIGSAAAAFMAFMLAVIGYVDPTLIQFSWISCLMLMLGSTFLGLYHLALHLKMPIIPLPSAVAAAIMFAMFIATM